MFNSQSTLATLMNAPVRPGRVLWIGLRPARRAPVNMAPSAFAEAGKGLRGDRYKTQRNGKRQITLIQAEHLAAIASYLGVGEVTPESLRRNVVTQGINLLALKGKRFQLGEAVLEYSGECHPCSRMEEVLGMGGYNATRGHGGITARIITSGTLRLGDEICVLPDEPKPEALE